MGLDDFFFLRNKILYINIHMIHAWFTANYEISNTFY